MNEQYLQYVREEIALATADFSGRTKGQLVALVEQLQFTNERYPRKRQYVVDEVTGKKIMLRNPPVPGKQSHAKGTSIPQVIPVEFSTASWRRAIAKLEDAESAWVKWNYLHETDFSLQTIIVQHGWQLFSETIKGRRMAGKTKEKLKALIWLAAQDVKEQLAGRETYLSEELAAFSGVAPDNWTHNYRDYWHAMKGVFFGLDRDSLISVVRSRSQQKATFSQRVLAKVN
ncbi:MULTISPECIES: bacteriophage antitermination protein Q [Klebsiella]|uniref:bacteriophage antitermination protein Q n=1 Tax=Klebsiella TaxID=570 RepID=UPI000E2D8593|nr:MULTISPECIES: bacteriophage antitermination protein Q [Klebsiella]MBZ6551249.1 antiterminator [Klebsiella michiganensis]MBZ7369023.1 antiterminator [Klebsiella michiganensis]SXX33974.1 phage antitermination protein Q [Klebsiella pneumoniae]SYR48981.1 phage antitermination protein Q [Klebsiella pneumoniae]HBK4617011.1 antiterminator [Klebsiella michiganensis]